MYFTPFSGSDALDIQQDNLIAYRVIRKQVELLLELIAEKTNEK